MAAPIKNLILYRWRTRRYNKISLKKRSDYVRNASNFRLQSSKGFLFSSALILKN